MNDFTHIREQFPVFSKFTNPELAYLDSAASAQKPKIVIDRMSQYLSYEHANIHRGAYSLSANATEMYEEARQTLARFLGARSEQEIIFTKGTTESINLVANSMARNFSSADLVLVSELDHHSNIVPWQELSRKTGCRIKFIPILKSGELDINEANRIISQEKPKLVAVTQLSNIFGTKVPIQEIIEIAHKNGAFVLIDAAQSIVHQKIDVKELDADFLVFSGHKLYGPTGIGVLYLKEKLYEMMDPYQVGGGMISKVTVAGTTWADGAKKYEAGTPPIGEAIALKTAVEFVEKLGLDNIYKFEHELLKKGIELLQKQDQLTLYGPIDDDLSKISSIISFNVKGAHPHDVATVCDTHNVHVRAGHHCAMPALEKLGIHGTVRASVGVYSRIEDFEALIEATKEAQKIFS